jgi:tripartite ATP-independent transporter DctM subunit
MGGVELGVLSLAAIVVLIYAGLHVPIALGLVSFVAVWLMRGNFELAINLLGVAIGDTVSDYNFATIPLFAMMGLVVSRCGIGGDVYAVACQVFRRVRGGLGITTVAANTVFAAVTGSSLASASVFTKVSVPEMIAHRYTRRFSVGVVAGSSVLGMLIPPSVMMIIYAFVAEQSIGHMFIAGIIPGLLLAVAFSVGIVAAAYVVPGWVGGGVPDAAARGDDMTRREMLVRILPVVILVGTVLGGIYSGVVTPVEAGAAGTLIAVIIGFVQNRLSGPDLWKALVETGHITAAILFLITAASMYSRMLGIAGLPNAFGDWLGATRLSLNEIMAAYVVLMLVLGTILDTASIILIVVPLFLPVIEPLGANLVWFGVVTVIGAEIGLLTPPLGLSVFTIKATIDDPNVTLADIFIGALPFAAIMLAVLVAIIAFPPLSLALI